MEIPEGWRLLRNGELLQEGDRYLKDVGIGVLPIELHKTFFGVKYDKKIYRPTIRKIVERPEG